MSRWRSFLRECLSLDILIDPQLNKIKLFAVLIKPFLKMTEGDLDNGLVLTKNNFEKDLLSVIYRSRLTLKDKGESN